MIEVILPAPLLRLAGTGNPVSLEVRGAVTLRSVLGALEARLPPLLGTLRDRHSGQRRAYVRFYACETDISDVSPDEPLPLDVIEGRAPLLVLGALSGG
ncbi:MoaD/ThiS family protein [Parahaliea maris]|uniref:MoaD/ThiS family protein n=1 Tax=Parahaliea maris TaxID=2716870 RepID=A0A5C9A8B6_9GAMM|nr:MoaD/ThiS family protein [Parahaliea maris]